MRTVRIGGRVKDARRFRRLVAALTGAVLLGGLLLGVASAAAPAPEVSVPSGQAQAPQPARSFVERVLARRQSARPLHKVLAARLRGEDARTPAAGARRQGLADRVAVGVLVDVDPGGARLRLPGGRVVTVRTDARTRLPARAARPGDTVLVIGEPHADGTCLARAVVIRKRASRATARASANGSP